MMRMPFLASFRCTGEVRALILTCLGACCTDLFIKEELPVPLLLWGEMPGVPMAEFILDGCCARSLVSC